MKLYIATDHRGFKLKEELKRSLAGPGLEVVDMGPDQDRRPTDYPDFAQAVARRVQAEPESRGVLICMTGLGMSIAANRFTGVRAALCHDEEEARFSRQHNNANVLVLAGRRHDAASAEKMIRAWLATPFEGGRHQQRVDKLDAC